MKIWDDSVRATHTFLSNDEILKIKEYMTDALQSVSRLFAAGQSKNEPIAFMGAEKDRLEMLFVSPKMRGRGVGKELLTYAVKNLGVGEVTVNEQNPSAVGFYGHMGFKTYKRSELDGQGNPYPLLYMRLF